MLTTVWGIVRSGRIELGNALDFPEGTAVLVTAVTADEDAQFWPSVSQPALDAIWDNTEDDVYAELAKV